MQVFTATVASDGHYELGEGPLWDEGRARVLWVDINPGTVHVGELEAGVVEVRSEMRFGETVGAVVADADGALLVAGARRVYRVVDDRHIAVHRALVPEGKPSRLNDGACDPAGRFLVGSMALDGRRGEECLYRLDPDGAVSVLDRDLTISNGLAWSPAGDVMYSVDTIPGVVWSRPYDPASGDWGERSELVRMDRGGWPDGLCVDADGNLWVAIWGGGEVRCYAPSGERLATVTVPAPHTTSVAFAGPGRDELLITTATDQLTAPQREQYPLSGRLFVAHVGATGLSVTPWSGA
ncbi:MAG TPA: SMP-30/gluconolactonase/LRE family protein [Solirubrobacteraceae bacterium]|nr:SMP-30/gluconolactonase/LRE family protein [Solirubrobacteraceae bacterium]